jgi:hypothetical protein
MTRGGIEAGMALPIIGRGRAILDESGADYFFLAADFLAGFFAAAFAVGFFLLGTDFHLRSMLGVVVHTT